MLCRDRLPGCYTSPIRVYDFTLQVTLCLRFVSYGAYALLLIENSTAKIQMAQAQHVNSAIAIPAGRKWEGQFGLLAYDFSCR